MAPLTRRERAAAVAEAEARPSSSAPAGPGALGVQRRRVCGGWTSRRISYASCAYFLLIILQIPLFRYEKKHSNIPAHISPCFRVKEGDHVIIGHSRPLSKTVRFNVLKVIPTGSKSGAVKKAFTPPKFMMSKP